jgi:hypothetical protein
MGRLREGRIETGRVEEIVQRWCVEGVVLKRLRSRRRAEETL